MADQRLHDEWEQTSFIVSTLYNVNRSHDASPIPLDHFNPYKKQESITQQLDGKIDGKGMIAIFCRDKK